MAVTDIKTIDLVGIDKKTHELVLTITDHLDWESSVQHREILQAKLNTYLAYIETGQISALHPDSSERVKRIDVVMKYAPDADGLEFLKKAAAVIENQGLKFTFETLVASSKLQ